MPVRILPPLPYDDRYLDGDAENESVESIVGKVIGFTCSGIDQEHGS